MTVLVKEVITASDQPHRIIDVSDVVDRGMHAAASSIAQTSAALACALSQLATTHSLDTIAQRADDSCTLHRNSIFDPMGNLFPVAISKHASDHYSPLLHT